MTPHEGDVFLFVNSGSGGNKGKDFLEVPQPFQTELDDGRTVSLHIYSLLAENKVDGFRLLKELSEKTGRPVRMIVGGGDGTVMWADAEATAAGINTPTQCIYGIIPLGTGNDFSRVAGWGGKNPKRILMNDCEKLHLMVKMWCNAKPRPHDVWQVTIEVDDAEGKILKVDKEKKEVEIKGHEKVVSLPMINYFSVGQESKAGIEFDKRRTKSQSCNLAVYAYTGFFTEMDCWSQQKIADLVSSLHAGTDASAPAIFEYRDEEDSDEEDVGTLVGNPESIMFLNVNSYAGGAAHFWQKDSEVAVDPSPDSKDVDIEADPGDGRIEVVTLPNIINIATDRLHSDARRVNSGGPYYMEFFHHDDALHAYCEVDGEFYHLVNPIYNRVTFNKKLQVLQNVDPDAKNILKRLVDSGKERLSAGVGQVEEKVKCVTGKSKKKSKSPKKT